MSNSQPGRVLAVESATGRRPETRRWLCLSAVIFGLLLGGGAGARAQEIVEPLDTVRVVKPTPAANDSVPTQRSTPTSSRRPRVRTTPVSHLTELVMAEQLIGDGRYRDAVDMLLPVWEKVPTPAADDQIASTLKRAYRALKDYNGVFAVLGRQLAIDPGNDLLLSELADAYFAVDRADSADAVITRLIAADPKDPGRRRTAAEAYQRTGRSLEALTVYRDARRAFADSTLFAEELARLYEARREYAAAVDEYFRWMAVRPEARNAVQRHITDLIKIPEAAPEITGVLHDVVVASPDHEYAHRLYGDLLAESGLIDSAFAEYRRADNLSAEPGAHRLFGLERCLETGHFQAARDEAVAFLRDYPEHPETMRVHFARAHAELQLGHPLVAIDLLKEVVVQIPKLPERARIQFEIGGIYHRHTALIDSAQWYYRQVLENPSHSTERGLAAIRLADIEVHNGRLSDADSAYRYAQTINTNPDQKEEIAYRRAELAMFTGDYAGCGTQLGALMTQYPRGLFVNDAMTLQIMLKESQDVMNWSLGRYAAALLALRQEKTDSALALLGQLVADSANSLADDAEFAIARIHTEHGRPTQAAASCRDLIAKFSGSFLVPRAWVLLGDLCAGPLQDLTQARSAYQVVLTDFRDSPLAEEARRRLQTLPSP